MEAQEIKEKALALSHSSETSSELFSLLEELEAIELENFLQKDDYVKNIDHSIRQLCVSSIYDSERLAELIATMRVFLVKGLDESNMKAVLSFLSINCYLNIELNKLMPSHITQEQIDNNSSLIVRLLSTIKVETRIEGKSYFEENLLAKHLDGLKTENLNDVYDFVEALERGGKGFHFNYLLENLIYFLYELDYSKFIEVLNSLPNTQYIVFYLQSFDIDGLLRLSDDAKIDNKWVNFEIVRNISEKENNIDLELYSMQIKSLLERIYETDKGFFRQVIKYLHRSNILSLGLGLFLSSLPENSIKAILDDFIDLNTNNFFIDQRTQILDIFKEKSSVENFKLFVEIVYLKWKLYFENQYREQELYLLDFLLTDYANYVVAYYYYQPVEVIEDQMQYFLNNIMNIDSIWCKDISKMKTNIVLNLSHFYLLSFAYKANSISSKKIEELYTKIKNDEILKQRFFQIKDGSAYWQKMDSNIL
ncbi:hypothetical protein [Dysgonomonas sp. BGC7]|uniref:hypothetical protein n=1 Tax=Dysgonomonas sp. BGC7 TaxID=1658008 RepID=UPI0006816799|nr:hypothetical protein [Dysgonomonas sp. BGC7]MBD8387787.1 hypothetical protein [Dysgonomonas sp. BGC7]